MRLYGLILWGCLLGVLLLAAPVLAAEQLIIAIDKNFPPFEFKDQNGNYVGFDIDLWQAIAREENLEYRLQPTNFNAIIPGLKQGQFDAAIAGITIKPERLEEVDFSRPYYRSGLQILVRNDDLSIASLADLNGKTVATKFGTTSADFVRNMTAPKELKLFPNTDAMFLELLSGGTDAVVFDSPVIADFLRKRDQQLLTIVGALYMKQDYAIAFPPDTRLRDQVNRALDKLQKSGEYQRLYFKWFKSSPEISSDH